MELKEIEEPCTPFDIANWCKTAANKSGGLSISQAIRIMNMIESYGKAQYNQALDDAAESVKCKRYHTDESGKEIDIVLTDNYFDSHDSYCYEVDKQSILNLKKH